jgi:hypothetical protein
MAAKVIDFHLKLTGFNPQCLLPQPIGIHERDASPLKAPKCSCASFTFPKHPFLNRDICPIKKYYCNSSNIEAIGADVC